MGSYSTQHFSAPAFYTTNLTPPFILSKCFLSNSHTSVNTSGATQASVSCPRIPCSNKGLNHQPFKKWTDTPRLRRIIHVTCPAAGNAMNSCVDTRSPLLLRELLQYCAKVLSPSFLYFASRETLSCFFFVF